MRRREAISFLPDHLAGADRFLAFTLARWRLRSTWLHRWICFGAPHGGLDNYVRMFATHSFAQSLKVTTIYTWSTCRWRWSAGLSLALLVNQKVARVGRSPTIFYLPSVLAWVAYVVLWM